MSRTILYGQNKNKETLGWPNSDFQAKEQADHVCSLLHIFNKCQPSLFSTEANCKYSNVCWMSWRIYVIALSNSFVQVTYLPQFWPLMSIGMLPDCLPWFPDLLPGPCSSCQTAYNLTSPWQSGMSDTFMLASISPVQQQGCNVDKISV